MKMKYRVYIECRNEHMTECIAYVVQAKNAREAKDRAGLLAVQHYTDFDEFDPYHAEEVKG